MECEGGLFESCDGEPFEFYQLHKPISRNDRICAECRDTIKKGEMYCRAVFKFDGKFDQHITCLHCHDLAEEIMKKTGLIVQMGELACAYIEYLNEDS